MEQDKAECFISIITPLYNAEKYIAEAIESVLNQTYQNWEIIIVDDCSSDQSVKIVEQYLKQDKRIKLIKNSTNQGVAETRNTAIRNISPDSKYIAFLDSDDIWSPQKLKIQIEFMEKNKCDFSFTDYQIIDNNGCFLKNVKKSKNEFNYYEALKGNPFACVTVMISTKAAKNMLFKNRKHEDYIYWLDLLQNQNIKAYLISDILAKYRKLDNSVSSNKVQAAIWTWNIYRERMNFLKTCYYYFFYVYNSVWKHIFYR